MKYPANFRDLGGIKALDGRTVKEGLLLRSGEPDELTPEQFAEFADKYDIRFIVDFRTEEEAQASKIAEEAGIEREIIDVLKNAEEYVTSYKNFRQITDPDRVRTFMNEVYSLIVTDDYSTEGYRRFLEIMLSLEEGAVLFHCFAGKDRTGIAAAILLTILGVSCDDIIKDYLMTNELRKESNQKILKQDLDAGVDPEHLKIMEGFLLVDKEYLETAFNTAELKYGSFDEYITRALGLKNKGREILKKRYLQE